MDWKSYYKSLTIKESAFFENEKTSRQLAREFDINVKRLENKLGSLSKRFNVPKIVYETMTGQKQALETTKVFAERDYTLQRLENMGQSYKKVQLLLNAYKTGLLNKDELTEKIEEFKKTNLEYLSNYK